MYRRTSFYLITLPYLRDEQLRVLLSVEAELLVINTRLVTTVYHHYPRRPAA